MAAVGVTSSKRPDGRVFRGWSAGTERGQRNQLPLGLPAASREHIDSDLTEANQAAFSAFGRRRLRSGTGCEAANGRSCGPMPEAVCGEHCVRPAGAAVCCYGRTENPISFPAISSNSHATRCPGRSSTFETLVLRALCVCAHTQRVIHMRAVRTDMSVAMRPTRAEKGLAGLEG